MPRIDGSFLASQCSRNDNKLSTGVIVGLAACDDVSFGDCSIPAAEVPPCCVDAGQGRGAVCADARFPVSCTSTIFGTNLSKSGEPPGNVGNERGDRTGDGRTNDAIGPAILTACVSDPKDDGGT
jgi:hypothetical protein